MHNNEFQNKRDEHVLKRRNLPYDQNLLNAALLDAEGDRDAFAHMHDIIEVLVLPVVFVLKWI